MAGAHRIGILTSGGDAPGMNPAIRAIVRTAGAEGITCIGIRRGYAGLINGDVFELTGNDVDGIARRGGTILYTARSEEFRTEAGVDKAAKVCKYLGIDGLITIGGDGTYRGALELARRGVRVVGIPATIDNDMGCTEYTIGFDTACNTAIEAIDKLRDTGQSHERVSVVEVMGRNAGHLALYTALAAGASAVLLICSLLDTETLHQYLGICDALGLSALVEAHDEQEIASAAAAGARVIGVNNRNLKNFTVDVTNSLALRQKAPPGVLFVAESGITSPSDVSALRAAGVDAVLVGEALMRAPDKAAALAALRGVDAP